MNKRVFTVLVLLCVLLAMIGCKKAKLVPPTLAVVPTEVVAVAASSATPVPPTVVPTVVPATPTPAEASATSGEASPTVALPATATPTPAATTVTTALSPTLCITSTVEGAVIDLCWLWDGKLGADDWFEVQIWPGDMEPKAYAWTQELKLRVTGVTLLPGLYNWRVLVVRGHDKTRGEELTPPSLVGTFTLVRPTTHGNVTLTPPTPSVTPVNTRTKTPTWTPTRTATPVPTATPTRTFTPIAPKPSPTSGGYPYPTAYPQPTNTNTPSQPTPTNTPGSYPQPSNTPSQPTPTNTPGSYPQATNTNTPGAKATNTPLSYP